MKKRFVSYLLMIVLIVGLLPPIGVAAATGGPAALTNPEIEPEHYDSDTYVGYYDGVVSNSSSLKIRWENVGADSYNVAVKMLYGVPNPGDNEDGEFLYDYTTGYTKTYISLSSSDIKSAAGKWVKVFVSPVFGSKGYPCHYYFQVEELTVGGPAELTNPEIEPEPYGSNSYVGYYDDVISNSSSLKIRWEDVDADSYNVAVKMLYGAPNPGDNEDGQFLYDYTTGYTKTYISLSSSDIKSAAGKWIKVYVDSVFGSKTYPCHYYFQVEELELGGPAALTNPEIEPEPYGSNSYIGYYDDEVSNSSSFKVRWEDVDADSYNVAVKLLYGEPGTGDIEKEDGKDLYAYTTGYTRTYISISSDDMKEAAGKWIKVYVDSVFGSKTYPCHYYFKVEGTADTLTLDKTSISLDWGKSNSGAVQISGVSSYNF